ncbi:hypothetical protein OU798_02445 [Prolixibacteraceae bacterium Z1-6]|uniref:Uncharacterized protein n=1 Tax=Draconibacterium aestuarii TaxID=2998507 RepID=A0A9X3F3M6_9BACT|nr:hypothetical protein [Prolixibacteraceae bacterium Z1-6]
MKTYMPMQDYSTLMYFVNNFQKKLGSKTNDFDLNVEDSLATVAFEPSERSIKNILDFARSYDTLETESAGYVEMNLN